MFRLSRLAVFLAGFGLAFAALAQDNGTPVDPPGRVARLSYMQGDVSFVPAGENDWVQAQLNRPLITGDKLWTDRGSRATLEVGAAAVRMDQSTSFDFLNLTDDAAQMELTQGTLNLRVRRLYDGQSYEIDTPTLAFVVNRVGEFRIDVEPDGQSTIVTVLNGGGDVYGEGGARFAVEEGQSVTFRDAQLRDYQVNDLPRPDAFDDFCHERDTRWDNSSSRRYVSEDVIGYQDLDSYGSWNEVPEYGNVWYPTSVAVGWSPYHYGHWGWVGAYGWTWIDDAPWGFAPFHYGRWAYIGGRWGWCPGPIAVRPVYAPALVAFIGGRGGFGVSVSVGGPIGWFPLGFRDVYIPPYRVSRNYFTRVNVSNTVINNTVINNYYGNYSRGNVDYARINYANRNINGAVTAVPAAAFVGARPVAGAAIAVNRTTFANARVSGFAALAPTRASLARPVAARAVPAAAVINRPIVAATRPPERVAPFAQRQAVLDKNPGRPLNERELRNTAVVAGAVAGGAAAAHAIATRPNVRVVTEHGAPTRTAAPALPARAAATPATRPGQPVRESARPLAPVERAAPTVNRNVPAVQRTAPAAATDQPKRLDSSRFAHPQGNVVPPAQPLRTTPNREVERKVPAVKPPPKDEKQDHGNFRGNVPATTSRGNPPGASTNRPEYRAPERNVQENRVPQRNVQQYQAPQRSVQENRVPQRNVQEYHPPVQNQQQYRAPERKVQEYHPPVQNQQQYQQRPAPTVQRNSPAPRQAPPERKKDDKNDKDGHH
ncbi:MAG TPA: DUF6600 domain-containing protein [Burkholderiales bacterium]|nr:DUF6600 domain-containing protein [Burkholderiales bacterium]